MSTCGNVWNVQSHTPVLLSLPSTSDVSVVIRQCPPFAVEHAAAVHEAVCIRGQCDGEGVQEDD